MSAGIQYTYNTIMLHIDKYISAWINGLYESIVLFQISFPLANVFQLKLPFFCSYIYNVLKHNIYIQYVGYLRGFVLI